MKITDVYKQHRINQGLQQHMVRVAAVAEMVAEHTGLDFDRASVTTACLLHDLGNLLKAKFNLSPELFDPEGVAYWKEVQNDMAERYGWNVHDATMTMMKESNVDPVIMSIGASFSGLVEVAATGSLEEKVLEYGDMRVGMHGIISVAERFADIKDRYVPDRFSLEYVDELEAAALRIEAELFTHARITPGDISDASTADIQKQLLEWELPQLVGV